MQKRKPETQGDEGNDQLFVRESIIKNEKAFKDFLMGVCKGNLTEYKEVLRSSIKEYLIKVENYINTANGSSNS